jgi:signal transduction histidine kinase
LARVLDNLVGNALKHTPEGTRVSLEVVSDGDRVALRVRDDGPGIPPEALPRLFERFYRVPGSGGTGSGLGLAMVREIAEWHGGCVKVESEPGAGSTFTVELPASGDGNRHDDTSESPGC